jgi:Holliday junction resolvase RusA-like endonuclease
VTDDWRWYVLDINPEPWAIGPVGYSRRAGKMSAYVGKNAQLDSYKEAVKEELGSGHMMIEGKVKLRLYFWRNRAEYTTPQARTHRKHEADGTNMAKATEDALQGVFFKNDKDVNHMEWAIVEQGPDVQGRVVIAIAPSEDLPDVMAQLPQHVCELLDSIDGESPQFQIDFNNDEYSSGPEVF